MVTILNEKSTQELWSKYQVLFLDAFNALKAANKLTATEEAAGTIVSLEQYFNHMGDLIAEGIQDARYIMLPMDETPFKINGNTRTVTVPSEFVTCGAVKGDMNCEIATFTIDRYFDYQDLANTSVYVQWQNANGEDGLSQIALFDRSEPGTLRFGWPLTNEITSKAGTVKFSVRFCQKDNNGKFKYILNTQPASLIVRDTLEIKETGDDLIVENVGLGAFALFVKNSVNPAVQTAADISFAGVGAQDLEQVAAINKDTNTLSMSVRATSKAPATVTYSWYYRPEDAVDSADDAENKYLLSTDSWYEINDNDYKSVATADLREGEEYWEYKDGAYAKYVYTEDATDVPALFKKYTTLTIKAGSESIVGTYWVVVRNSAVSGTGIVDNYKEATSTICTIQGPKDVDITTNLKEHMFVEDSSNVNLAVGVHQYPNEVLSYQWKKATKYDGSDWGNVSGETKSNLETSSDGWYKVAITSSLNRKTAEPIESAVCRVTHHPATPVVTSKQYKLTNGEWTDYTEEINVGFGAVVELKLATTPAAVDNLVSDELTYKWTVQPTDGIERDITASDVGLNGIIVSDTEGDDSVLHGNTLKVRCVKDGLAYTYRCSIANSLAGETKTIDKNDRPAFIIQ